ncbi:GNAT family N-acetyltransferase [Acidovorax sp. sic0104]|uniref:GNAT family N-acetyltransferase n=1 Tax=Acidovorax sp. sic0104 TaxID=2854784 RepID=UPI001C493A1D|nr:GNAT family N-acetyltransferase [Acidovorax sp. sic0104]MBV7541988.1 GNAT family N-acetyltransferase [Acidovorax sp. sic0104]
MIIRQLDTQSASHLRALREVVDVTGTMGSPKERETALRLETIEALLEQPHETLGGEIDGVLVGAATLSLMPEDPWDDDGGIWFGVSGVMVHPDFSNRSYGRQLMMACLTLAADRGARGVLLEVNVPNPLARRLYESLGFDAWYTSENAYERGGQVFDRVCMKKLL